ncbi:TRAP transporter small permease [Halomonas nitroreducens]|uniref:TRAP transporter small permease protein n=1 Tax=Halomonas nitroreducens TaxID=447425 RepID=A0A431UZK1_9GAMM|nr:TRAP transporter small permease [Halomonas nitroreducens]RTQ99590.1 TRAP transporter small permease [Halomonas nitroreducens]
MMVMRWLDRYLEETLSVVLLATIVFLVCANVAARHVFEASLPWGEELIGWVFIWFIWVAVSYVFRLDQHIEITLLRDLFPLFWSRVLHLVVRLMVVVFLLAVSVYCIDLIMNPMVRNQVSVVLQMPIPVYYASAPFGALLASIRILQNCWRSVHTPDSNVSGGTS